MTERASRGYYIDPMSTLRFVFPEFRFLIVLLLSILIRHEASAAGLKKAMNLTTYQSWGYTVDSTPQGERVKSLILRLKNLGFNHLTFNVRAKMVTGTADEIVSFVPPREQETEERLLEETIEFAHSHGFTTGIRPILLVVGPRGEFPYTKNGVTWWHGNIEPKDRARWFVSLKDFHNRYLQLAARKRMSQYTIGAELHSMTTGLGDRRPKRPRGEPAQWAGLVRYAKSIVGATTEIVHDVNYTDQYVLEDGVKKLGGEFEQFRFELTREYKKPQDILFQNQLRDFWNSLDVVGIDMYRALASRRSGHPADLSALAARLRVRSDSHATQLDTSLLEIEVATGVAKNVELKEIGYRSVEGSFVDPASYESSGGQLSVLHQAAGWKAILDSFLGAGWPWFTGVHVWETNVDRDHVNARDLGFSPLGKPESESVFLDYFSRF